MLPKIRYRLCYNYAGRLNRNGCAPVALECRQGTKRCYFSTQVILTPDQWEKGMVVNHDNAEKLTAYLIRWMHQIEEIELDALLKGKHLSLFQLKTAVKTGVRSNAPLEDFVNAVINESTRGKTTKQGYKYLINEIKKAYGNISVDDITHDFIERYRADMHKLKLSDNTIKGRLKLLRCIVNEAIKRNLITDDPFKFITIGNMQPRREYLTMDEITLIENAECINDKERKVKDLFMLGCWTGLRFSDLTSLEEATIKDGVLTKIMKKTHIKVTIPIATLFWGKGQAIIDKYKDITKLSHCIKCNSTANRAIKEIAKRAGLEKDIHFHIARKSTATILSLMGMAPNDIATILGHQRSETTSRYYLHGKENAMINAVSKMFKDDKEE